MFRSRIYVASPSQIQEQLITAWATARRILREGSSYRELLAQTRSRERWPAEKLLGFQSIRLRHLLKHAANNIPHYAVQFNRLSFKPDGANLPRDMASLPVLTKRDVLEAGDTLISKGWRRGRFKNSTSGTTGTPLTISQDLPAIVTEQAFIGRQLDWSGYIRGEPRAWLRGEMIVPFETSKPPYWRMNRADNALMLSSYHLSESTAAEYLGALAGFGPTIIQAYPSSIGLLARFLKAHDASYRGTSLRAILTSSESLLDEDRVLIEDRFRCKVFDWYGGVERVAAIGTCRAGVYHLLTDYSYVELAPVEDGVFELIGTGLNNYLMPFIRYRTGDLVELPKDTLPCECGMAFPVIRRIHGRQDDYIKLRDGRQIGRIGRIFYGVPGIAEAQVVQEELDRIRINVVPFRNFPRESQRLLVENARQRLGEVIEIEVEIVASIARTGNGKFRTVVCKI